MFGLVAWVVFGLIVGLTAYLLMPSGEAENLWLMAILGIAGALAGGYLGSLIGLYGRNAPAGFLTALTGAVAMILFHRFAFHRHVM